MTALILASLVTGASLLVAEAHLASYGLLGIAGVLALAAGGVMAVEAAGGSLLVALALVLPVALVVAALVAIAGRKALAVSRRRPSNGLVGRVGVVRHPVEPVGDVLVAGELWRARCSWDDGEPPPREGEHVVVERVHGLTLSVRRAEEWELMS
jgi:membrane protein implicated in regulation of membrane protease activity